MKRSMALLTTVVLAVSVALSAGAPGEAAALVRRRPRPLAAFVGTRAVAHAANLAAIGARKQGTAAESAAVDYCIAALRASGYVVTTVPVKVPNGTVSRNVIATRAGRSTRQIVFGAHLDTKSSSPGANDNGSGVGVVLELARVLRDSALEPTVVFVLFGAEEMIDANPDHHHYGSRAYVARLSAEQVANVAGMVSVDMVGYGTYFYARTMAVGPTTLQSALRAFASDRAIYLRELKDTGRYGWSDHEPFERAGIPVAWLEWKDDPYYHTTKDTAAHLQPHPIGVTGTMLTDWGRGLTAAGLDSLRP
jgi:Zn-dependent M28 family amino/carboxypeptidase